MYMNTLKQTFGHSKDISSAPRVYDMNPIVLSGMALNQQFQWFTMAMVNNIPHAIGR